MPPKKGTVAKPSTLEATSKSRRRSHRISLSSKKSTYFEDNDNSDEELPPRKIVKTGAKGKLSRRGKATVEESDDELQYEDVKNISEDDDQDAAFAEDNSESEAEQPVAQRRGRGRPPKTQTETTKKSSKKSQDLERTKATAKAQSKTKREKEADYEEPVVDKDSDDDDDDDDDDENRITFIPAIQLRDTDGVEYEDTRLHKNTFLFLEDLKANNQRSWLKSHDGEYRRSFKDWESFVETLTEKIIEADETIPWLPVKDVIFRIYRDVRFSKDQTPYKPHYSAAWSRTGRKGPYACYYVHVEPGRCLVGGGVWHPEADALARLRASVDERPHRISRVLTNPTFRKTFLPEAKSGNEKSVIAAFAAKNQDNALKTKPKVVCSPKQGFHPDHKYIELLKLRNYTISTQIDESDLLADDAQENVMSVISAMVEFVTFLNSVVRPDPNAESDSDEADGGTEEQEDDEGDDEEE
ncbi:hypothetical protein GL218_07644 [Daldinia childiae]|uniref:uncharacterized protein n=1 Tax=Daldinia childiae TaxID=326645 RepID=UPI0014452006|nr:uncharacterized protein GL218_07644 [Daldinia childiae]KAF3055019.1 hypothetical protein GL218_07644 [Daldinia childiae]